MQLEGNVAIVTGASRGVGRRHGNRARASAGASVACAARATDAAPLPIPGTIDDTVRRIEEAGGEAIAVPTNLANDDEIDAHGGDHDRNVRPRRHPREQRRDHVPRRPRTADEALRPA